MKTIAIIGGGAAGLAAAIAAAREADGQDIRVVVFEAADRVGKSILATGNGRCNFSNSDIEVGRYYNSEFVQVAFEVLSPGKVLDWFSELGLCLVEEGEGRLYPATFRANTVLDVLRFAARDLGVVEYVNYDVQTVTPVHQQFLITFADSQTEWADAVIVACGHHVARSLIPVDHRFENTEAILCPLQTDPKSVKGLDSVRVRAAVSIDDYHEEGEVLFRAYGVSGIVIFNISRFARKGDILSLDFLPKMDEEEVVRQMKLLHDRYPARPFSELLVGLFHPRIIDAICRQSAIEDGAVGVLTIQRFAHAAKQYKLEVLGKGDPKQAQVFRGGFTIDAFDPHTMQSNKAPGLYVCGESLDVDGPCGGYNLHWAWTSGILAGQSASRYLEN